MSNFIKVFMLATFIFVTGCASKPTGAHFHSVELPNVAEGNALLVFYRDYSEPTGGDATILIDRQEAFSLPNRSFAIKEVSQGSHHLALQWPALMMMPGWTGSIETESQKHYFFKVNGTSSGFVFHSRLDEENEGVAYASLRHCCRQINGQKGLKLKASGSASAVAARSQESKNNFSNIIKTMSPSDVTDLIGSPDEVTERSTGKQWIPFYFGSDIRRVRWNYSDLGYVEFTKNKYSGRLSVVEVKAN